MRLKNCGSYQPTNLTSNQRCPPLMQKSCSRANRRSLKANIAQGKPRTQERMMTSSSLRGRGGRVCDCQKFETGGISRVYNVLNIEHVSSTEA